MRAPLRLVLLAPSALLRPGLLLLPALLAASALAAPPPVVTRAAPQPDRALRAFVAPAGPDAEALLLSDRYTLRPDGTVVHERAQRLRVNSFLAINRDLGETRVVWDPSVETFEVLHNRTVLPSGEVVPAPANAVVDELPPAVHRNPLWSALRRKVIVHTALEPGAVVEASWRVTRKAAAPPGLTVAEPLAHEFPVAERLVEVEVPAGTELLVPGLAPGEAAPECATTAAGRSCRWRLTGVPALGAEPGGPPRERLGPHALAAAGAPAAAGWAGAELQRRWDAAGPAPAGAIAVARKAAGTELDRERSLLAGLSALADAVSVSAALPAGQTGWAIHPLASVWDCGWASPLEMAALSARVLGELGFDARPGLLLTGPLAGRAPGFERHDRAVVVVRDGGLRLYDPLEPAADRPLELTLDRAHLVVPGEGVDLGPLAGPWQRRLRASLAVDEKGDVKGELALTAARGATPQAGMVRDPRKLAERLAGGLVDGAKVTAVRVTALSRGAAALAVSFEGKLPERNALGLVVLPLAGVPGGVADELPPPPGPGRSSPVAWPGPGEEALEVTVDLPEGWTAAGLPAPAETRNEAGSLAVGSEVSEDGSRVSVRRVLSLAGRLVPAARAAEARELLVAWTAPASRGLLLRPPSEPRP